MIGFAAYTLLITNRGITTDLYLLRPEPNFPLFSQFSLQKQQKNPHMPSEQKPKSLLPSSGSLNFFK